MISSRSKKPGRQPRFFAPALLEIPPPDHLWHLWPLRIAIDDARQLTGRSARTVARWRVEGIGDPACLALLRIHAYGLIPHSRWREWAVDRDGFLNHWGGRRELTGIQPGHLHAIQSAYDQARSHRQVADQLRREVDQLTATLAARESHRWPPFAAANDSIPAP